MSLHTLSLFTFIHVPGLLSTLVLVVSTIFTYQYKLITLAFSDHQAITDTSQILNRLQITVQKLNSSVLPYNKTLIKRNTLFEAYIFKFACGYNTQLQ